jgi:hypothetical protein
MKAKYVRKSLFETNKHFERRVNDALNTCIDIDRIILDYNYVTIIYKENSNVKSPKKIQGFYLTSNKE